MTMTFDELAQATGAHPETLALLRDLELLSAPDDEGRYAVGNLSRVRLLLALSGSGIDLHAIASAVERGEFSLVFIDVLAPIAARLLPESQGEFARQLGISESLIDATRAALGTGGLPEDAPIRSDDAMLFREISRAAELGADEVRLLRVFRSMADLTRRMVATQRDFVDEAPIGPLVAQGMTEHDAIVSSAATRREYRLIGRAMVAILLERFVEDAIFQNLVEQAERALANAGVVRARPAAVPAIVFVDIAGYTRLAEESGDFFGSVVNVASRVANAARSGEVLVTERVVAAVGGADVRFGSPRPATLTNLAGPVLLWPVEIERPPVDDAPGTR